jgi:hypothetical protein
MKIMPPTIADCLWSDGTMECWSNVKGTKPQNTVFSFTILQYSNTPVLLELWFWTRSVEFAPLISAFQHMAPVSIVGLENTQFERVFQTLSRTVSPENH